MHLKKLLSAGALLGAFLLTGGALAQQPGLINSGTVLGNSTAAARTPTQTQVPALFDRALCNTAGSYLVRTTTGWQCGAATTPLAINTTTGALTLGVVPIANGGTGQITAPLARAASGLNVESFTGRGDSIYTILATDRIVGTNAAFTASRTWTLPAANAVNAGQMLIVADYQGTVTGANTLIIARAGADTINGGTSVTISSTNGAYALWSDGTSKWTAQTLGAASGVSSLNTRTGALSFSIIIQTFCPSGCTTTIAGGGTGTYTPTTGTVYSDLFCYGGGGGGGGASSSAGSQGGAGGGGAGSKNETSASAATIGASQTVTIGAAGTAGAATPTAGGNGGDSSIGAIVIGKGGSGAASAANASGNGGLGGVAGTGTVKGTGSAGGSGLGGGATAPTGFGGIGASTDIGGGGNGVSSGTVANGVAGNQGGGGGSGGFSFNGAGSASGGAGGAGYCLAKDHVIN